MRFIILNLRNHHINEFPNTFPAFVKRIFINKVQRNIFDLILYQRIKRIVKRYSNQKPSFPLGKF